MQVDDSTQADPSGRISQNVPEAFTTIREDVEPQSEELSFATWYDAEEWHKLDAHQQWLFSHASTQKSFTYVSSPDNGHISASGVMPDGEQGEGVAAMYMPTISLHRCRRQPVRRHGISAGQRNTDPR